MLSQSLHCHVAAECEMITTPLRFGMEAISRHSRGPGLCTAVAAGACAGYPDVRWISGYSSSACRFIRGETFTQYFSGAAEPSSSKDEP